MKEVRFFKRDDVDLRIRQTQDNIEEISHDIKSVDTEVRRLEKEHSENHKCYVEVHKQKTVLDRNGSNLEKEAKKIQVQIEETVSDESIEIYENEIRVEKERLQVELENLESMKSQQNGLREEANVLKEDMKEATARHKQLTAEAKSKLDGLLDVNTKRAEKLEEKRFCEQTIVKFQQEINDHGAACQQTLDPQISKLNEKIGNANLSDHEYNRIMQSRRSRAVVEKALADLKALIAEKAKEVPENREELELVLGQENEKHAAMKNQIWKREDLLCIWKSAIEFREQKFLNLRDNATVTMCNGFSHRLALRENGYSGKLLFDHEDKKLTILVKTAKSGSGLKSNSQLSGGERSFTTVCFITAMWSAVAGTSPFKILDEFDVFMDMVNRKVSMDYLLEFASHESEEMNNNQVSSTPAVN